MICLVLTTLPVLPPVGLYISILEAWVAKFIEVTVTMSGLPGYYHGISHSVYYTSLCK